MAGGWNQVTFKVTSNPNPSMFLCCCQLALLEMRKELWRWISVRVAEKGSQEAPHVRAQQPQVAAGEGAGSTESRGHLVAVARFSQQPWSTDAPEWWGRCEVKMGTEVSKRPLTPAPRVRHSPVAYRWVHGEEAGLNFTCKVRPAGEDKGLGQLMVDRGKDLRISPYHPEWRWRESPRCGFTTDQLKAALLMAGCLHLSTMLAQGPDIKNGWKW